MAKLSMDAGLAQFKGIMDELMRSEAQPSTAAPGVRIEAEEFPTKFTLERSS